MGPWTICLICKSQAPALPSLALPMIEALHRPSLCGDKAQHSSPSASSNHSRGGQAPGPRKGRL